LSHIVTVQTKVHDAAAVTAACHRLGLTAPEQGTTQLFMSEATGLIVHLPDWDYPVVIDTLTGRMRYDNFGGRWGEQGRLDQFLQTYAVEKTKLEARRRGHTVTEQALQDGSIRLQLVEGI
jgi:hypothetical protein